jgi:hypothetical protein
MSPITAGIAIASILVLTNISVLTVQTVHASDIICRDEPQDDLCTGERGAQGMGYCGTADRFGDCYDGDFSRIDCSGEHNESSRCTGYNGREGLIFCDKQFEQVGYRGNCFER